MMRIFVAGAACALLVPLAGCNRMSDEQVKADFRQHAVESCVSSARGSPNASQFDWPRLCGCAIDRYMAGKNVSDLQNANPQDPALRSSTQQCAMEQVGGAMGGPGAPGEPTAPGGAAEENGAANTTE
jgi:hypothetical protein